MPCPILGYASPHFGILFNWSPESPPTVHGEPTLLRRPLTVKSGTLKRVAVVPGRSGASHPRGSGDVGGLNVCLPQNVNRSAFFGVSGNGGTPKSSIQIGFSTMKQSIWGYPHLWRTPYVNPLGPQWFPANTEVAANTVGDT